ncbi:MAG: Stp1/IreP family PP2C-type Ser/Thr phosphatase [Syntrophomonas sp.]
MKAIGISDLGLHRKKNEDSYLINQSLGLFVICDGMGGHRGGDVASQMAVNTIDEMSKTKIYDNAMELLNNSIQQANRVILQEGNKNPEWYGMGTTVTAAMVEGERLTVANVGDSSLYIIRDRNIRRVTKNHTLAEQLVSEGILKADEIRQSSYNHILTRALGVEEHIEIDDFEEVLLFGDFILMCSDGLSDMLDDEEMLAIVLEAVSEGKETDAIARNLLKQALNKGGYDNITIIILSI